MDTVLDTFDPVTGKRSWIEGSDMIHTFKVGDRVEHISSGELGRIVEIDPNYGAYGAASIEFDSGDGIWSRSLIDLRYAKSGEVGTSSFEQSVRRHTDRTATLLIEKNKSYGDSALNPVRIFSKADRMEQLYTRLDDKLSRVQKGHEYPGDDTIQDIIGYCLLVLIARESN